MEKFSAQISVVDVYDIASAIGKEFERIIELHGTDVVTSLMPKVINALEHLESLCTKNEREDAILEDLRNRVIKLEHDKLEKAEDRIKYEKELEQIEEDWRKESNHLVTVVAKLQDENKRLAALAHETQNTAISPEVDVTVISRLQHQIEQQREKIKVQMQQINLKNIDIDKLENQVEQLNSTIKELRRGHRTNQSQVQGLIDERADTLKQLQEQHKEILTLRQKLGVAQKENEDLSLSSLEDVPDLRNKVIYDIDDPNRPRFTTNELRDILYERNELKSLVNDLQDELNLYRKHSPLNSQGDNESEYECERFDVYLEMRIPELKSSEVKKTQTIPSFFPSKTIQITSNEHEVAYEAEEDAPVQGPLPCEPDDAPWKRSESGIRKFFRKVFGDTDASVFPGKSCKVKILPNI